MLPVCSHVLLHWSLTSVLVALAEVWAAKRASDSCPEAQSALWSSEASLVALPYQHQDIRDEDEALVATALEMKKVLEEVLVLEGGTAFWALKEETFAEHRFLEAEQASGEQEKELREEVLEKEGV